MQLRNYCYKVSIMYLLTFSVQQYFGVGISTMSAFRDINQNRCKWTWVLAGWEVRGSKNHPLEFTVYYGLFNTTFDLSTLSFCQKSSIYEEKFEIFTK